MCSTCDCDQVANKLDHNLSLNETETDGNNKLKPCRRCGACEPYIILDKVHVECKNCFLVSCNKKIRSTIGRSRLLANNDPILIAYSGGLSSCALLDLIQTSMSPINKRDQKFQPSILHVDMQVPFSGGAESMDYSERCSRLNVLLQKLVSTYPDWPVYWTTFEMCLEQNRDSNHRLFERYDKELDPNSNVTRALMCNESVRSLLISSMTNLDLTDKQQSVQDNLVKLINSVAEQINTSNPDPSEHFKYVFTASSSTKLANDLLVDTILGRGCTLRSTVDICDSRLAIPIVRPMRDFSKKEIAFYLRGKGMEPMAEKNLLTFADRKASIQTVTESFLSKIDVDYPSTYSTLLRTGNKLL